MAGIDKIGGLMREEFEKMAMSELRDMAKEQGIKGISTMKKSELVDALAQKARLIRLRYLKRKSLKRSLRR